MKLSFVQMPFYTVFKYKNVFPTVASGELSATVGNMHKYWGCDDSANLKPSSKILKLAILMIASFFFVCGGRT